MAGSLIVASQEIGAIFRQKTFILLLVIFIGMTLASTFIGWFSVHTIQSVYDWTVTLLTSQGKAAPPPPFANATHLSLLKNMVIYVVLIAALLAIIVGHMMGIRDRKAGVIRLIFSRNITQRQFLWGKVLGMVVVLGGLLLAAAVISIVSSALLARLTFTDMARVLSFYGVSFLYLIGFSLFGLVFGLTRRTGTLALLVPLMFWLAITFVLPELSSALSPTASLNPTLPQADINQSAVLNVIHTVIYPFSISEQFKTITEVILQAPSGMAITGLFVYPSWLGYLMLPLWTLGSLLYSFKAMKKFRPSQGDLYE